MIKFSSPIIFLLAIISVVSCSGPAMDDSSIPEDLEGKKQFLREKRKELLELTELIATLEGELEGANALDEEKSARLVITTPVVRKDFMHYVDVQGSVIADDMVDVAAEASGRILKLYVKEGDFVRSGQLVADLDMEAVTKQREEVVKALELANTVFERQKRLWEQNIGSEIQYLETKNSKERLEKSLETIDFQLSKAQVFAPAGGVVEREILQAGELAAPGAPIVQLLNTQKLKVVVDIPENFLTAVKKGDQVAVHFPALGAEQEVRVSQIGRMIDPSNRTFKVEAQVQNASGFLKPNLLAIMKVNDYSNTDQVVVPLKTVLQEIGGKNYVMVAEQKGGETTARKVYVTPGETFGGEVIISAGLNGGEMLILEGARGLANGELIKPEVAVEPAN